MDAPRCHGLALAVIGVAPGLLAPSPARAADCSAADAAAFDACLVQLEPGDTLTLEPGELAVDNITLDGLAGLEGAPIVIRGSLGPNGEHLSHVIGQSSGSNVIDIIASSHLELRDFELSFVGGTEGNGVDLIKFGGMAEASHHVVIDNCELHDAGNVAISSQAREIHDIVVTANHIHDIGGSCFYWGYYEDDNPLRWAHHSQIIGNLLQRCPVDPSSETHYGIQLKSGNHDNLIADNVMVDVGGTTRAGIIVYHSALKPVGSALEGSNRITGNLLVRPRNEGINAAAGAIIDNNIVVDAGGIAIFLQPRSYGGATYYGSIEVLHNTVVQTLGGAGAHGIRWTAADWSLDDPGRPSRFVANLALMSNGADGLRPPSAMASVDANATDGPDNGAANTVVLSDPSLELQSLVFGEPGYLVPVEQGLLVDGVAGPTVALDFAGARRDASPDIGAYEWTGVVPPVLDEDEPKGDGDTSGDGDGDTTGDGDGDTSGDSDTSGDGDGDGDGDTTEGSADESGEGESGGNEAPGAEGTGGCSCASSSREGEPAPDGPLSILALMALSRARRRPLDPGRRQERRSR